MNLTRLLLVVLVGAVLTVALVACGDDDDDNGNGEGTPAATDDGDQSPSPTRTVSEGNDFTPQPAENQVNVTTRNFAFDPPEISVPAGEPVTFNFTNEDSVPHTFTLYLDEDYTQAIDGGSADADTPEISVSFVDPGEYYFRCEVHPGQMQGELTAE